MLNDILKISCVSQPSQHDTVLELRLICAATGYQLQLIMTGVNIKVRRRNSYAIIIISFNCHSNFKSCLGTKHDSILCVKKK